MHNQPAQRHPPFLISFSLERLTIRSSCFNDTTNLPVCEIRVFECAIIFFDSYFRCFSGFLCFFHKENPIETSNLTSRRLTLHREIGIIGEVNQNN